LATSQNPWTEFVHPETGVNWH